MLSAPAGVRCVRVRVQKCDVNVLVDKNSVMYDNSCDGVMHAQRCVP